MKKSTALLASLALGVMASSASATDFLFTFSGAAGVTGASGTLSATQGIGNSFTATSGTISEFGPIASGTGTLIPNPLAPGNANSPSGFFFFDNQLLTNSNPLLTDAGLLFNVGGQEINIFFSTGTYTLFGNTGGSTTGTFALSEVAAVPEPATWAMMLLGFGMIGFAARNRRQKVRVTYA